MSIDLSKFKVTVERSPHAKCERCHRHREEVGQSSYWPDLCERCSLVLMDMEEAGTLPRAVDEHLQKLRAAWKESHT